MCGIAGLVAAEPGVWDEALIARMLARLTPRGPDDQGILTFGPNGLTRGRVWGRHEAQLVLLHRRLAILDVSAAGWQPMATRDERFSVVYNGELYNYLELREELARSGATFRSRSDTEVLLEAWAQWGADALPKFEGMYAFAILDRLERTVTLARDPFGIKPLYWTAWRGGVVFASEIKVLLELPGLSRAADPSRLWSYLRYGLTDHGDATLFHAVRQVPAGHVATLPIDRPQGFSQRRFWAVASQAPLEVSFEEAAETVRRLFLNNVARHVRSDVAVGAALSGGLDSSAIVAAMRQTLGPTADIHTVSYLAEDPEMDESRWSSQVAHAVGARPHAVRIAVSDLEHDLDRLVAVQDEPFASSSIYAQFRVFQAARDAGIKVMLDGQGADEMLAGYPQHVAARLAALLRGGCWVQAVRFLGSAADRWPGGAWRLLAAGAGALVPGPLQASVRRLASKDLMPDWVQASWFRARGVEARGLFDNLPGDPFRARLLHALQTSSLPMLLRYEDRNSMAHSVESRVPFLTTALVEYVTALPPHYLVARDGTSKSVFRRAMAGLVPEAILRRRDKIAFTTPEAVWLRGAYRARVEREVAVAAELFAPVLEASQVRLRVRDMLDGRRPIDATLWRLVNLGVWGRVCAVGV